MVLFRRWKIKTSSLCRFLIWTLCIFGISVVFTKVPSMVKNQTPYGKRVSSYSRQKVVILFTTKRSGSTFLGEVFNQNPEAFYLFEPLFPFTRTCDLLREERINALRQFTECNFKNISEIYKNAFTVLEHTDKYAQCLKNNICFEERHLPLLARYESACQQSNYSNCQLPLKPTIISAICSKSKLVVYKILRVCELQNLAHLIKTEDLDIRIVHLVRDPRAILSSRMKLIEDQTNNETLKAEAKTLCNRLRKNIRFSNSYWKGQNGEYMRIRHEDITTNPMQVVREIYRFVDEPVPHSIQDWVNNSMSAEENIKETTISEFSTVRKPSDVLNKWRRALNFPTVQLIQAECLDVLQNLGYLTVKNEKEQNDETLPLW
uniref:carbohydrate sulfotransferase 3-like n=1 Tax=Ciona intestinalis TaxID=7719 RepID=UPI000180CA0D|nr:carbohydrate sulfotransferase 3-like [Ciona intestinalis]|eukprot:XP_002130975.1 carbohydrate sulfotransferase 3-like [Ciona intestinalis]